MVGGQTVIYRQARQAISLGCGKIICFANGLLPELAAVQHFVERTGLRFHIVRNARALIQLIDPADEIIAIEDGVLADSAALSTTDPAVYAFPAELAVPAGYERIDREHCWAGVVQCYGAQIAGLVDLPEDIDPLAALMRCALQAGHPVVTVQEEAIADGSWWRVDTAAKASMAGQHLLLRKVRPAEWSAPGNALMDRIILRHAEDLLARAHHGRLLVAFAGISLCAAAAGNYLGSISAALLALAAASLAMRGIFVLHQLASDQDHPGERLIHSLPTVAIDLAFLAVVAVSSAGGSTELLIYPFLVLVAALHLAARAQQVWLQDIGMERTAVLLLLAVASWSGAGSLAAMGLSLGLMGLLFVASGRNRLTVA